jgi:hypothetical protein
MSDIIASPSTRRMALEQGVDIDARARELGRTTLGPEDLVQPRPCQRRRHQLLGCGSCRLWPVTQSRCPLRPSRRPNLGAANALIPQVTHHDRADISAIDACASAWRARHRRAG